MKAPGVYIREVDLSEMVPVFGDKWKQEYLCDWWMEEQNKPEFEMWYRKKSDWDDIDKLFKEEL